MSKKLRLSKKDEGLYELLPPERRKAAMEAAANWIEEEEASGPAMLLKRKILAEELRNEREKIRRHYAMMAAREKLMAAVEELDTLVEPYNAWLNVPVEDRACREYANFLSKCIALLSQVKSLASQSDLDESEREGVSKVLEDMRADEIEDFHRSLLIMLHEEERQKRIESHTRPEYTPVKILCKRCQKKEARLEGFCKKCARAEGILVHGKII